MASGAGKGNFGSKFRNLIGGKKKQKLKYGSTGSIGSAESDDEGYMDPEGLFSTEPPGAPKPPIPDYPPPTCPGSKVSPKSMRPYSSIDCITNTNLHSSEMRDYARSLDNSKRRPKPTIPEKPRTVPRLADDYSDPWDSKASNAVQSRTPANQRPPANQSDNYMDPYDSKGSANATPYQKAPDKPQTGRENYMEPWDSRSQPLNMKSKHRDDYKDPWDTEVPGSLPKSSFEEDDDYTVPYDAGKPTRVLTANGKNPPLSEMDDLYDVPYEEQIDGARAKLNAEADRSQNTPTQSNSDYDEPWEQKSARIFHPTQKPPVKPPLTATPSQQQQQQSRDDYDAPWEWSNNSLTKAFANLPPPSITQPAKSKVDSLPGQGKSPTQQPMKAQFSVEHPPTEDLVVFKVNSSIPLENQNWYHGKISRFEAEALLKDQPDCSFLLRDSESSRTDFSLSLRNNNEAMHLKISCRGGRFILGQHSKPYESIPEMIKHYSTNTLNIRGAEQVKLIYPVLQEAMYFTVEPGT